MRVGAFLLLVSVGCADVVTDTRPLMVAASSGRTPGEARGMDLQAYTGQADLPEGLCGEAFLSADFALGEADERPTLHVAASASENAADGSRQAPFRTLSEALAFANAEGPATIVVAAGSYDDFVTVPPGMRVLGGYDAEDWSASPDPARVTRMGAVAFQGASDPESISELANFRVEGAISIGGQARVMLHDNVLIPELVPTGATEEHLDSFAASAVHADSAFLHAQGNQLLLPTVERQRVNSLGFDLQNSCARIVGNDIEMYRTPLGARDSEVAFNFNFVAQSGNGVVLSYSVGSLTGNYFHLEGPRWGFHYAVYLVGSRPALRYNEFQLHGRGSAGVNEATPDSDPLELVGNEFHRHGEAGALYLDRQDEGQDSSLQWLEDIGEVNSLPDIPVVSGNVAFLNP